MRGQRASLVFGNHSVPVEVIPGRDRATVRTGDGEITLTIRALGDGIYAVTCDARRMIVHHATDGSLHYLHVGGEVYTFQRGSDEGVRRAAAARQHDLRAPMPGVVTQILVREGQAVPAGEPLFVLEGMKMETVIRAAVSSRVSRIHVAPGAQVDGGAIVVEVENLPEGPS